MLDLQVGDTVRVDLTRPASQKTYKMLPPATITTLEPCGGISNGCQMMTTDRGIRIITKRGVIDKTPECVVRRLDSDGQWRLATEKRPNKE